MIYSNFAGKQLSLLGFGAMRLPVTAEGAVDEQTVEQMVRYAMDHGVNYFDTSPVYLQGQSEQATGIALKRYPRESYFIATKL